MMTPKPIDFFYEYESHSFDLSKVKSDEDLVAKIQTGMSE